MNGCSPADLARRFASVRTARIALRRPLPSDGPAHFRIHGDPEAYRYSPIGPDPDLATSEGTLRRWLRGWDADGYGYWAVSLAADPSVIGFGGVRRFDWRERTVLNLYYRFAPATWGHGYATETAGAAIRLARMWLPHLPIVARVFVENLPSQRTAARVLPRRPDLDTPDHLAYALAWDER